MQKTLIILITILLLGGLCRGQEKAAMSEKDLEKYTYYFEIIDDKLVGDGAKFLTDELKQSQYVLLGEYHGSYQLSKFTKAIIPILDETGFKTFGLEIGPVSVEILSDLSKDSSKVVGNLKEFNSNNYFVTKSGRTHTPIPFFSYVEDADFLAEARKRKWNLLGLDQEFSFGYVPLIQRMYENLSGRKKVDLKPLYEQVTASIKSFYEADKLEGKSQYKAILDSKEVNDFLSSAAKDNPANQKISEAIKFTTEIYYMNDSKVRKYYDANSGRVNYMKRNLSEGFSRLKFDIKKDKMLLKMGGVHTGRGYSPLALFEIGNTLSELAVFNGNRSIHIDFGSRYYIEDGKEVDALSDAKAWIYRFQPLLQMSKKDKWTIIDLRPLRSTVFYAEKFNLSQNVLEIFKNHDLYIIAPLDKDPTPNYVRKN